MIIIITYDMMIIVASYLLNTFSNNHYIKPNKIQTVLPKTER